MQSSGDTSLMVKPLCICGKIIRIEKSLICWKIIWFGSSARMVSICIICQSLIQQMFLSVNDVFANFDLLLKEHRIKRVLLKKNLSCSNSIHFISMKRIRFFDRNLEICAPVGNNPMINISNIMMHTKDITIDDLRLSSA